MRILLIVSFFPFLIFAAPFTVATYNVENLFDAVYNGTEYEEYIPEKHGWNRRMVQMKLNHTAEVICDLDADIIALQEIENENVFRALRKRLERVGCTYRYGMITHKKGAPIQVALLSRFPIRQSRELQVSYAPRVRNILEVEVEVKGVPLTLFVNHWKSKSRKGYESKRIAYAKTLRKRLEKMPREKDYIILGDLNSNYNAHLTLPKRLDDVNGRRALNHILHTTEGREVLDEDAVRKAHYPVHYDLWLELPFRERWSHKFYGRKSTLDHILLPPAMFDGKGIDYINDSFKVFKRRYLFTAKGYINSWKLKGGSHTGKGYSDHLPLVAQFDTVPYRPSAHHISSKPQIGMIEDLYAVTKLDMPIILKDAVVVLKRGRYAILKQKPKGRGIFVYGAVQGLDEGKRYDLEVQDISVYRGLKEITSMVVLKEKGSVELASYYASLEKQQQNEVVRHLTGMYKNGYFYVDGEKIPIYFKNRRLTPPNGAKLKIDVAHIGYYKKLQLVVYSRKDFTILEN
jgi:endonuclease/exonuclease/phosphatase family metal-dependent hydrolase